MGQYVINILGLDNKEHHFRFEGGTQFFKAFGQETEGSFAADIKLKKSDIMIQLSIHIQSKLHLVCDRTLRNFEEAFESTNLYIFKFGDKAEVLSDELEVIPTGTDQIDLAQHLYDFIQLSVPLKRIHPELRTEDEDDDAFLYTTHPREDEQQETDIDPRWKDLLKLKLK